MAAKGEQEPQPKAEISGTTDIRIIKYTSSGQRQIDTEALAKALGASVVIPLFLEGETPTLGDIITRGYEIYLRRKSEAGGQEEPKITEIPPYK